MGELLDFTSGATARESRRTKDDMLKLLKSAAFVAAGITAVMVADSVTGGMISKPLRGALGA